MNLNLFVVILVIAIFTIDLFIEQNRNGQLK